MPTIDLGGIHSQLTLDLTGFLTGIAQAETALRKITEQFKAIQSQAQTTFAAMATAAQQSANTIVQAMQKATAATAATAAAAGHAPAPGIPPIPPTAGAARLPLSTAGLSQLFGVNIVGPSPAALGATTTAIVGTTNALATLPPAATAAAAGLTTATTGMAASFQRLERMAVATFLTITATLTAFTVHAVHAFADFQAGLAKAATQLGTFSDPRQLTGMGDQVIALGVKFGQSFANINKALFDNLSATFSQADAFKIMATAAQLAVTGATDVLTTTRVLTSVLIGYGLGANDAERASAALFGVMQQARADLGAVGAAFGKLLPTLSTFRGELTETGAVLGTLTHVGTSFAEAQTQLERLILSIAAPTERATKYFKAYADMTGQATITLKRLTDGTIDYYNSFKQFDKLSPDALRRLFPSIEAFRGITFLLGHLDLLKRNLDAASHSTDNYKTATELMNATARQAFSQLREAVNAFFIKVGEAITQHPTFLANIKALTAAFVSLAKAAGDTNTLFGKMIWLLEQIVNAATSVGKAMERFLSGPTLEAQLAGAKAQLDLLERSRGGLQEKFVNVINPLLGGRTFEQQLADARARYEGLAQQLYGGWTQRPAATGRIIPPQGIEPPIGRDALKDAMKAGSERNTAAQEAYTLAQDNMRAQEAAARVALTIQDKQNELLLLETRRRHDNLALIEAEDAVRQDHLTSQIANERALEETMRRMIPLAAAVGDKETLKLRNDIALIPQKIAELHVESQISTEKMRQATLAEQYRRALEQIRTTERAAQIEAQHAAAMLQEQQRSRLKDMLFQGASDLAITKQVLLNEHDVLMAARERLKTELGILDAKLKEATLRGAPSEVAAVQEDIDKAAGDLEVNSARMRNTAKELAQQPSYLGGVAVEAVRDIMQAFSTGSANLGDVLSRLGSNILGKVSQNFANTLQASLGQIFPRLSEGTANLIAGGIGAALVGISTLFNQQKSEVRSLGDDVRSNIESVEKTRGLVAGETSIAIQSISENLAMAFRPTNEILLRMESLLRAWTGGGAGTTQPSTAYGYNPFSQQVLGSMRLT